LRASEHIEVSNLHRRLALAAEQTGLADVAAQHHDLERSHSAAANALQKAYQTACQDRSVAEAEISPLYRYGEGGAITDHGIVVDIRATSQSAQTLTAEVACHQAWMMIAPSNMADCPLDLPNVNVKVVSDSNGLHFDLSAADPYLVNELQRRVQSSGLDMPLPNRGGRER
jgi:hypothetical protein